jgi:hypothetical protein
MQFDAGGCSKIFTAHQIFEHNFWIRSKICTDAEIFEQDPGRIV